MSYPRKPWHRDSIPWWGWVFLAFARLAALFSALVSLLVVGCVGAFAFWLVRTHGHAPLAQFVPWLLARVHEIDDVLRRVFA